MMVEGPCGTIDTSGLTWTLGDRSITFEPIPTPDPLDTSESPLSIAFRDYMRSCCRKLSATSVAAYHHTIKKALRLEAVRDAILAGREDVLSVAEDEFRRVLGMKADSSKLEALSILRRWYIWAADRGYEAFDEDVATFLSSISVGNARLGTAVLRSDPGGGPLTRPESAALEQALWRLTAGVAVPFDQIAAVLLLKHLGVNVENLRRLDESDLSGEVTVEGFRVLKMPRIKKGRPGKRDDFVRREIHRDIAELLDAVIAANRMNHPPDDEDRSLGRPMFRGASEGDGSRQVPRNWFLLATRGVATAASLQSDLGDPMRLFPRRLRYTFAKERVEEGISPADLMVLLDHSSEAVLLVYYNARLDVVRRIDHSIGDRLEPFARVALGRAARSPPRPPFAPGLDEAPRHCLTCRRFIPSNARLIALEADAVEALAQARRDEGDLDLAADQALLECQRAVASARRAVEQISETAAEGAWACRH